MNILMINHEFPPVGGGGATACKHLAGGMAQRGHQVTVLTCAFGALPEEEDAPEGYRVRRVPCRRSSADNASFAEMLSFVWAAYRALGREQGVYDHLLVFFGIPSGPLGWIFARRWKIPYSVRLGGGDVPGTQKRFTYLYPLLAPALRKIWRDAAWVIPNSQGLLEKAQAFSGQARFQVVPNGMEAAELPEAAPREDGAFRMVTTARILERKGIHHAVRALAALSGETGGKVCYTVVGDGPYRGEVERLAAELGVSACLHITGMLPREAVLQTLCQSDVFVLPSAFEGMSNAVLEAMGAGLPIVMTNCEGSDELVQGNGMVVDLAGDLPGALAKALGRLARDEGLRAQMGAESRRLIRERFSVEGMVEQYLALLEASGPGDGKEKDR